MEKSYRIVVGFPAINELRIFDPSNLPRRLERGPNLLSLVEVFHCEFHLIMVTELLAGQLMIDSPIKLL